MDSAGTRRDFDVDLRLLQLASIAVAVGILSTCAAYLLLHSIRLFTNIFFFQTFSDKDTSPAVNHLGAWVIAVPVVGGILVGWIARFGTEQIRGHGIPEAIESILFRRSVVPAKVALLKPLASGIAIGSGGPFGAEGPIIMTGGAVGSLVAQHFHLSGGERKALLVAGAAAGMTAIFGTPVAAVLLGVELLLFELRPRSLLPVGLACAVAAFLRPLLIDSGPMFPLATKPLPPTALVSCLLAGTFCGMLSWILSKSLYRVEDAFQRLPFHWMWWPAIGGLAVGLGGFLEPRALGVGYDVIRALVQGRPFEGSILGLLLVKSFIWLIALGSGTSGGVLAPLLTFGAGLGAILGPHLPGGTSAVWPLVFLAATLGGMMRAPIMAVVFAFEMTHDSDALLPVLTASLVAYAFTVLTMGRSILTEKISRHGHHTFCEFGASPLERHCVGEVMQSAPTAIDAAEGIAEALEQNFHDTRFEGSRPVTRDGVLLGMVDRLALRDAPDSARQVGDLLVPGRATSAHASESCRTVAARLAACGLERIPVVDSPKSGRLVGMVSRGDLLQTISSIHAEEHERRKLRQFGFRRFRSRVLARMGGSRRHRRH